MRYLLAVILLVAPSQTIEAQLVANSRVGLSQPTSDQRRLPNDTAAIHSLPRTYWLPGSIVGGLIGLDIGLGVQDALCAESHCDSLSDRIWFLIPTLVFGVVGGLIGSAIHRR